MLTRLETRDHVELRVELKDASADKATLEAEIKAAVNQACRLKINAVNFVEAGSIE